MIIFLLKLNLVKDLFYVWNIYAYAINNIKLLDPIIERIDKSLLDCSHSRPSNEMYNFCLLLLMKAICLKYQGRYKDAEVCLNEILAK